jgi:hypothetical protein
MFYFAWVDKTETTFSVTEHAREDEKVFGFTVTQSEGDFATLDLELVNPNIGLLAPSRKQWAWLAWDDENGDTVPLFFGRLIGVPEEMAGNVIKLTFVARPTDYEDQLATLADTMRVAPWYDPVWLSPDDQLDPNRVLEGYSKLWHVDRVTGLVTASDIIAGEDGTYSFADDEVFYDTLSVAYSESPARSVIVEATVDWTQRGSGTIDLTSKIIETFAAGNTGGLASIGGAPVNGNGMVSVVAGDNMIKNWPKENTSFGGNWTVGISSASLVGLPPTPPVMIGGTGAFDVVQAWQSYGDVGMRSALRTIFDRSPGIIVQVVNHNDMSASDRVTLGRAKVEFLWIPVWRIAPVLQVNWDVERARTEVVRFTLGADVQPLLTDADEAETVRMNIGPVDVDGYIGDARRSRYFNTEAGQDSLHNLIARARAILLYRARAIDVSFEVPFHVAAQMTCRQSGYIEDSRIPGGNAAGKVKAYAFSAHGDSGELVGSVVLACTVGRDGTVAAEPGDPDYCVSDYVGATYQDYDDVVSIPLGGDVGYTLSSSYPINDDGVNLFNINRDEYLLGITLNGTLDTQKQELEVYRPHMSTSIEVIDRANSFTSDVTVRMRPIRNSSFNTVIEPTLTALKIPRTIDLEETV